MPTPNVGGAKSPPLLFLENSPLLQILRRKSKNKMLEGVRKKVTKYDS